MDTHAAMWKDGMTALFRCFTVDRMGRESVRLEKK